ncbi:MAG: DUF456 family protein [Gemmatimonadota bacterium]
MDAGPFAAADLLFLVLAAVGLFLIPVGLGGLWVILGGAVLHRVLAPGPGELGILFLALLALLALAAELAEALLGVLTAKRFGASRRGMWGAFLGGIVGAVVFSPVLPVVGTLAGALVGAFAGAFALEWTKSRTFRTGWRAGLGAFVGRVAAVALKTAVGLAMIALVLLRIA